MAGRIFEISRFWWSPELHSKLIIIILQCNLDVLSLRGKSKNKRFSNCKVFCQNNNNNYIFKELSVVKNIMHTNNNNHNNNNMHNVQQIIASYYSKFFYFFFKFC